MKITWGDWAGWEAYIQTKDGARLPEHRVNHYPAKGNRPATSVVYVEYEDGQEFGLYAAHSNRKALAIDPDDIAVWYKVDGRCLQGTSPDEVTGSAICASQLYSYEKVNGELCKKNLRFEPLKRVSTGFTVDEHIADQLGTIVIELEQVINTGTSRKLPYESPPPRPILNKNIKPARLSSDVGGQKLKPAAKWEITSTKPKPGAQPYKVIFEYYTRKMLMAMNVIPNPKSTPLLKTIAETFEHITPSLLKAMSVELEKKYPDDPADAPAEAADVDDDDWTEISEDLSLTIKDALSKRFK